MKMLKTNSHNLNIANFEEYVHQFFILHETVQSIELDLSAVDAEMILLGALVESFNKNNPFEVSPWGK